MTAELYPRFSAAEFARRHAAARALMAAEGLDALVVYGNSGVSRHDHADVHYLSGFLGNRNNYVVMTARDEPVIFVQSFNHVPNAREASAIRTEWGGASSAATIAKYLIDAGLAGATLGYVGDVPVQSYLAWQRELAGWQFKDVTRPFRRLRLVKSAEEIEWLRQGAAFTDAALERLIANVKPGMREYELGALIEADALGRGGLPHLCYISSGAQEGEGACVPRQNLSDRVIERGDVINTEISVSFWGYSGQMHRPIFVQSEPSDLYKKLWDTGARIVRAVRRSAARRRHQRGRARRGGSDRRARLHHQRRFSSRLRHRAAAAQHRHARVLRAARRTRAAVHLRGEHVRRGAAQCRHA